MQSKVHSKLGLGKVISHVKNCAILFMFTIFVTNVMTEINREVQTFGGGRLYDV